MGRKMSCSSKRNNELGSCSSTLVSSTKSLRPAAPARAFGLRAGAAAGVGRREGAAGAAGTACARSEEHTSELQSRENLVCRLLLEKKKLVPDLLTRKVWKPGGC